MAQMQVDAYQLRSKMLPLLRRFEAAQAGDDEAEKRIRKLGCTAGLLGLGGFLGIFVAAWAADQGWGFVFVFPVAAILAAIVYGVKAARHMKYDLDDRRLEAVVRLLRMLRADTPSSAEVQLGVDFRDYQKGGSLEGQGSEGGSRTARYRQEWLSLEGVLADGTQYRIAAIDAVSRKERRKRKYTKVKERIVGTVQLQLRLKSAKYGDAASVAAALQQSRPRPPLQVRSVRATGNRVAASLVTGPYVKINARRSTPTSGEENLIDGEALLAAMLWAYDGIGRSLAKGA